MAKGPSRHATAVEALELHGHEHVLEIGCGQGVAVRLVLDLLSSGMITALDRSPKMIETVRASVQDARLLTCAKALEDAPFGAKRFDVIFAVNLDLNLRLPHRWPAMLKALLQPGGRLVLLMEAPPGSGKEAKFASQSLRLLREAGFEAEPWPAPDGIAIIRAKLSSNAGRVPVS